MKNSYNTIIISVTIFTLIIIITSFASIDYLIKIEGNSSIKEVSSAEVYCKELNLTIDTKYIMQDGWVRCCSDWYNISDGYLNRQCDTYQYKLNEVEDNVTNNFNGSIYVGNYNFTDNGFIFTSNVSEYLSGGYFSFKDNLGESYFMNRYNYEPKKCYVNNYLLVTSGEERNVYLTLNGTITEEFTGCCIYYTELCFKKYELI